jgi:hypothetical protein
LRSERREHGVQSIALPSLIRSYVERNVPLTEVPRRVRFAQVGEMQLKPGRWLPFAAEQEMAVDRVEFAWRARFRMAPLVSLRVVDWYRDGDGGLAVRLWGRVPVTRARGAEVVKGEAMRYLAELPWVPQAMAANRDLEWRAVDESTVEVATPIVGVRVAVLFRFDADGDICRMSAGARGRMVGKETVPTPWSGTYTDYESFDGVRVPTKAELAWLLPGGPFTYFRSRLHSFEALAR